VAKQEEELVDDDEEMADEPAEVKDEDEEEVEDEEEEEAEDEEDDDDEEGETYAHRAAINFTALMLTFIATPLKRFSNTPGRKRFVRTLTTNPSPH